MVVCLRCHAEKHVMSEQSATLAVLPWKYLTSTYNLTLPRRRLEFKWKSKTGIVSVQTMKIRTPLFSLKNRSILSKSGAEIGFSCFGSFLVWSKTHKKNILSKHGNCMNKTNSTHLNSMYIFRPNIFPEYFINIELAGYCDRENQRT